MPLKTLSAVDVYLKDIAKVPLLKAEEEIEISTRMRDELKKIKQFQTKINKLTAKQEEGLKQAEKDYQHHKRRMISANCRLVVSVARKYHNRHLTLSDLIEEGNIGLIKAVEKFDPSKGFRFSTFAIWWIKQSIIKAIKDKGSMVRIPIHISKDINHVKEKAEAYRDRFGHDPLYDEMLEFMDNQEDKLKILMNIPSDFISTNTPIGETQREIGEMVMDDDEKRQPVEQAIDENLRSTLKKLLSKLTEKESKIITMRYGLDNNQPSVLDSIGKDLGITRERVRQIQVAALKKLKNLGKTEELKQFLE